MRFTPDEIKARLKRGTMRRIARRTGRCAQTVSNVIRGQSRDEVVLRHLAKALGITVGELTGPPPEPMP